MSKEHWQNIYTTKLDNQVSWTQKKPTTPLNYLLDIKLNKNAKIIDIDGGTSRFVDFLLDNGYTNVTVLDISESAINRTQQRLGERASEVKWIVCDILEFKPKDQYQFWYDRAVFHFLNNEKDISTYVKLVNKHVGSGGHFLLGTFSLNGPVKCSGLEVQRYSAESMKHTFQDSFFVNSSFTEIHITPFETEQEFQFCGFVRI